MSADAVVLNADERQLVADAFGTVVREQGHRIYAAATQATHVHLVFAPLKDDLKNVVARLKRRSAIEVLAGRRRLAQQDPARIAGLYSRPILGRNGPQQSEVSKVVVPRSLWTAGKFPVYIFDDRHLGNAIEYVRDHNRRVGLSADPFDWIEPLYPAKEIMGERFSPRDVNVQPSL